MVSGAPRCRFVRTKNSQNRAFFRACATVLSVGTRDLGLCGAAYRTRTCDPRITNAMLYQLS
jgi:hypothetical protein